MKIVCISDTHTKHRQLDMPDGDMLIVAGDWTATGTGYQIEQFNEWLEELDYKYKIVIAGNHEIGFEDRPYTSRIALTNAVYLQDSGIEIEGLKIWGTPWQPEFCDWAFNLPRNGEDLNDKFKLIPDYTDIVVSHGPPYGILDTTNSKWDDRLGCEVLLKHIERVKPKLHIFGHIHEGHGVHTYNGTTFINAASLCGEYKNVRKPIVYDTEKHCVL